MLSSETKQYTDDKKASKVEKVKQKKSVEPLNNEGINTSRSRLLAPRRCLWREG